MESQKPMNRRLEFVSELAGMMELRSKDTLLTSGLNVGSPGVLPSFHGHLVRTELNALAVAVASSSWSKGLLSIARMAEELHLQEMQIRKQEMFSSFGSPKKRESLIPDLSISGGKLQSLPLKEIPMKQAAERATVFTANGGLKDKFMQSLPI